MSFDVRIDFIARRRWPAAGLCLAVVAAGAIAWQGGLALSESDLLQRQRTGLAALQRQASAPQRPAMTPEDIKRHAQVEAIARHLATPWERLLALFEEHAPSRVVLMKFEPDATEGRVEVTGRAPGPKALAAYIVALERDPRLSDVMLHHHEVLRTAAGTPVEFTLGAAWETGHRAGLPIALPAVSAAASPVVAPVLAPPTVQNAAPGAASRESAP
jgi:Tfp pilus assembly protein PilN